MLGHRIQISPSSFSFISLPSSIDITFTSTSCKNQTNIIYYFLMLLLLLEILGSNTPLDPGFTTQPGG